MASEIEQISNKLDAIQSDLNFIKDHMADTILTDDDIEALDKAEKDLKEGKTKRI